MKLFQISRKMKNDDIVFIIGAARSGTSILYRTLQKHQSFKPIEEDLTESQIINYPNRSFLFNNNVPSTLFEYMLRDEEEYKNFIESIKTIKLIHKLLSSPLNRQLSRTFSLFWFLNLNHLVWRSYFYHAKKARGSKRLIEKTPFLYGHIKKLISTFPNCKMIHIFRHPVDTYSSYRKIASKGPEGQWANQPIEYFCRNYMKIFRIINKKEKKHEGRLLSIKYEDFTKNAEVTCKSIFDFLGEHFDKESLVEINPDLNRWKYDPHLFGNITTKTKEWNQYISYNEARLIENSLEHFMGKLNYPRYTNR